MLDQLAASGAPAVDSPLLARFRAFTDSIPASAHRGCVPRLRQLQGAVRTRLDALETFLRERTSRARTSRLSAWRRGRRLRRLISTTPPRDAPGANTQLGCARWNDSSARWSDARDYGLTGSLQDFEQEWANRPGMSSRARKMMAYATDVLNALQTTWDSCSPRAAGARGCAADPPDREAYMRLTTSPARGWSRRRGSHEHLRRAIR